MIDHVNGKCFIRSSHLTGWMDRIMFYWGLVKEYFIQHIYREQNQQANSLSKKGLLLESSSWSMEVILDEKSFIMQDFSLPGA